MTHFAAAYTGAMTNTREYNKYRHTCTTVSSATTCGRLPGVGYIGAFGRFLS